MLLELTGANFLGEQKITHAREMGKGERVQASMSYAHDSLYGSV